MIALGGRLDGWESCLAPGNRPAALTALDPDATVLLTPEQGGGGSSGGGSGAMAAGLLPVGTVAWTTAIEDVGGAGGAGTHLGAQRWVRRECSTTDATAAATAGVATGGAVAADEATAAGAPGRWRLELHETVPYAPGSGAGGLLRGDCRGCVALLASRDTGTSGGLASLVNQWV